MDGVLVSRNYVLMKIFMVHLQCCPRPISQNSKNTTPITRTTEMAHIHSKNGTSIAVARIRARDTESSNWRGRGSAALIINILGLLDPLGEDMLWL